MPDSPLEAGRALDMDVASAIGWTEVCATINEADNPRTPCGYIWSTPSGIAPGAKLRDYVPRFSTDPAAALQALEEWQKANGDWRVDLCCSVREPAERRWCARHMTVLRYESMAPTLPLAICRLIANGRENT